MYCPRLDHFVRFNPNGTVSRCGHMVNPPEFDTVEQMDSSKWLSNIKSNPDTWPKECVRCQQTEQINHTSIRLNAVKFDKTQTRSDYLTVGGVLDNICNSACQSCNQNLSTKIGSLISSDYPMIDNSTAFWQLPLDRVVHLEYLNEMCEGRNLVGRRNPSIELMHNLYRFHQTFQVKSFASGAGIPCSSPGWGRS